jgi:hypothetical protein
MERPTSAKQVGVLHAAMRPAVAANELIHCIVEGLIRKQIRVGASLDLIYGAIPSV